MKIIIFLKGIDVNWGDEEGVTALQIASANGRDDIVEYLLCHDAIVDKPNCLRWTPLMHAARNGHPSTVEVLLSYGADVQLRNEMGNIFTVNALITLALAICTVELNLCSKFG
jgi:ankyrin repeat protein